MSEEVDYVLDTLASVVDGVATDYGATVKRIDRDNSYIYEGSGSVDMTTPTRSRSDKLESGVLIGATSEEVSQQPIGTEYDLDVERVVSLRAEGLYYDEYGHVDPDGNEGVPWDVLTERIRSALYEGRTFPDAGRSRTGYTHLILTNEADLSSNYSDYYEWRCDVALSGYETL